ncbi:MAG TPA: ATP-binding protein [Alphaproteobacteria bacterium]|nr:ATP-binding protein [Alphaproteobacteria bacterium]
MTRAEDLPIRRKIMLGFALLACTTVGVGAFSIAQLAEVDAASREVRDNWLPSTRALGDLKAALSDYRIAEGARLLAATPAEIEAAVRERDAALEAVTAGQDAYARLPKGAAEEALYLEFLLRWQDYRAASDTVAALPPERRAEAVAAYKGEARGVFSAAAAALDRLSDFNVAGGVDASLQVGATYRAAVWLIAAAIAAQFALVALATRALTRHISRPIVALTRFMADLAEHPTGERPPHLSRRDEIGSMARSVEVFRRNALALDESRTRLAEQARALEAALETERSLSILQRNFVSMASHEFRTPLTVIDGHARRIVKSGGAMTPDEVAARLGKVRGAVARLMALIGSILDSARLGDGDIRIERTPCDIGAVVRAACEREAEYNDAHAFRLDIEPDLPPVDADRALIEQAVANLAANAVKYSPPGPIEVTCRRDAEAVVIAVRDHGPGVPDRDRARLFERYFRGSNAGAVAGSGVGLYLVDTIARRHGGAVAFEPAEGGGSRFLLRLPIDTPEEAHGQAV